LLIDLMFIDKAIPVSDPVTFGGREISDALDGYTSAWTKGKSKLESRLDDLLLMLVQSVATYEKAETSLGAAAHPGNTPPAARGGGGGW
jgi:hypothetical protein